MKRIILYIAVLAGLIFAMKAFANEGTTLSGSFQSIQGQTALGFAANTEYKNVEAEISGAATGGVIQGNYEVGVGVDVGKFNIGFFQAGEFEGTGLNNIARTSDLGAKGSTKVLDTEVGFAVYGRNGGVFANPNALDILKGQGVNIDSLDQSLANVYAEPNGLTLKKGSRLNVAVFTTFDLPGICEVEVNFSPEVVGKGSKIHQLITSLSSNYQVKGNVSLSARLEIATQLFEGNIEREFAAVSAINVTL